MRIYDIHPIDRTAIDPVGRAAPIDPMRRQPRIPAGATSSEPPGLGVHEAARWAGDDWELVPDWRGHVYWTDDGERHEITELGIEPPVDAIDSPRPSRWHEWAGGAWIKDEQAELDEWRETATISSRQGEQQIILSGLDEQVEAAIDGIADTTERKLTRAWYQRATVWERNNPQLIELGKALKLTEEQIDDLFVQASEL